MPVYREAEPVYCSRHVSHEEGVVQTIERRTDIRPCFGSRTQSAAGQYASRQRTDIQFVAQTLGCRLFLSRELPYVPLILQIANLLPDGVPRWGKP